MSFVKVDVNQGFGKVRNGIETKQNMAKSTMSGGKLDDHSV